MKYIKYLFAMSLVLMVLIGCQKVSDTRTEFCDSLRGVGTQAVEFKEVKVTDPINEWREKVDSLQQKRRNLERLARLTPIEGLDKLVAAIDTVVEAVESVSGNTLGPAADRIKTAGANLETVYLNLDNAVCAAK